MLLDRRWSWAVLALSLPLVASGCSDDSAGASSEDAGGDGALGDADAASADAGEVDGTGDAEVVEGTCPNDYLAAESHGSYVPDEQCPSTVERLIIMGDSISAGTGAPPGESYSDLLLDNDESAWPEAAEWDLSSRFGAVEVVDVAFGGAMSTDLPDQLENVVSELGASVAGHTVVVVTIGGNDLVASFLNPGLARRRLETNLRTLAAFYTDATRFADGVSLYVMNVYDPSDGVGQVATCFAGIDMTHLIPELEDWRDLYASLGDELGFAAVDALHHFKGHGFFADDSTNEYYDAGDPTQWFSNDCIHPNPRGHHEIRRLFFEAIARDVVAD